MSVFDELKNKYNKNPKDNVPRMVYGPPDAMRKFKEKDEELKRKYNLEPSDNIPQEVYGTPDSMCANGSVDDDEILFRYSRKPSYGKCGDDGGTSITVYTNKKVAREKYVFGCKKSVEKINSWISDRELMSIVDILTEYEEEINMFNDEFAVCDGNTYEFRFGTKVVHRDDASASGLIQIIANKIMTVVDQKENKYNIDPRENNPQRVYGIPNPGVVVARPTSNMRDPFWICKNCGGDMIMITDPIHFLLCRNCERCYDSDGKEIANPLEEWPDEF